MGKGHIRLRYVHTFTDRHGRERRYYRRGGKKLPLPSDVPMDHHEFLQAYAEAAAGFAPAPRVIKGSVSQAIQGYILSGKFAGLAKSTQTARRAILLRFEQRFGRLPLAGMTAPRLHKILEGEKPFAAQALLKAIRDVMKEAVKRGDVDADPTKDVRASVPRTDGFHMWTEGEVAAFEAHWPLGTRERLAFGLLRYTGQRRSDVVRMGRQHIRDGVLSIRQGKTGTVAHVPLTGDLRSVLDTAGPNLTFLVTQYGEPFTAAGFGAWFARACKAAGVPDECRAHGLRKAFCTYWAEQGSTAPQIAAMSGHLTMSEVQRYIEKYDRERLVRELANPKNQTG